MIGEIKIRVDVVEPGAIHQMLVCGDSAIFIMNRELTDDEFAKITEPSPHIQFCWKLKR